MSAYTSAYGQRLQRARVAASLSQTDLGDALGLHRSSIANLEAGRQACTAEQVVQHADTLGIDPHWLLTGRGPDQAANIATVRDIARYLPQLAEDFRNAAHKLDQLALRGSR